MHITASGLVRVARCPASVSLPAVLRTSDVAERGTYIHRFLEHVLNGQPRGLALSRVPEELRETCKNIDYKRATGDLAPGLTTEVSYGLNVYSGVVRNLGSGLSRGYPAPEMGDIFGTTDIAGVRSWDDVPVVIDWKTGFDDVAPTRENPQLQFAASCVALLTGAPEVEGRVAYVRPSGRVDVDPWTFTSIDVDAFVDDLVQLYDGALAAKESLRLHVLPPLRPGDHCDYCPAFPACPAQVSLARALVPDLEDIGTRVAAMTPAQAGIAWTKLQAASRLVDTIKGSLKVMARQTPLPTDETHEVREITFAKRAFSAKRALELLRELGATEEQIASCEPKHEQSQVRELKRSA